ncbi:MAG: hypothetical protein ACP5GD_01410 [Candidatus Micrarchaeia archaeon]|jgi:hypothetical protein
MAESKEKLRKKLEALRKLQQTRDILQEGGIQNVALQTSADDQRPTEDSHVLDLLERSKIKRTSLEIGSASKKQQHSKQHKPKAAKKKKRK